MRSGEGARGGSPLADTELLDILVGDLTRDSIVLLANQVDNYGGSLGAQLESGASPDGAILSILFGAHCNQTKRCIGVIDDEGANLPNPGEFGLQFIGVYILAEAANSAVDGGGRLCEKREDVQLSFD